VGGRRDWVWWGQGKGVSEKLEVTSVGGNVNPKEGEGLLIIFSVVSSNQGLSSLFII
jgi:hypothetical protein